MRKKGSSSKSPRGGKRRAVSAGRHVTEHLAGYKREVARPTEETRGQQRLLDALLLPCVQLENTGPFKLPSHLLHCSSIGVSVDPEGPGPGALSKCKQTKFKEEMEDHEIRDHDEAGDPRAAGDPEKAGSEATDSDLQSGHLEEIVDDLSSGIKTEDSEDGPFKLPSHLLHCSSSSVGVSVDPEGPGPGALSKCKQTKVKEEMEDHEIRDHDEAGDPRAAGEPEKAGSDATDSDLQSGHLEEIVDDLSSGIETEDSEDSDYDYYLQEPCKLTPQTQGKKSKEGVVSVGNVEQSNCRPTLQSCRPTPQSCKVCPASFPNVKLFLRHIHEHNQECAWCGLRVRATQSLEAHLQMHTQCPGCEKTFHSYRSLKKHINFGCAECGKQFKTRYHLDRHAKCHTGEKPLSCRPTPQSCRPTPQSCKVCPASFPNSRLLLLHIHEHEQGCAWCGLRVRDKRLLRAHLQTHTQCPGCEKTFRSFDTLKQHIRDYVPNKYFGCAECGKQFKTRQNLYYHEKGHTGEKPFSCTVCHAKFKWKGSMVRHMKAHSLMFLARGTMYD